MHADTIRRIPRGNNPFFAVIAQPRQATSKAHSLTRRGCHVCFSWTWQTRPTSWTPPPNSAHQVQEMLPSSGSVLQGQDRGITQSWFHQWESVLSPAALLRHVHAAALRGFQCGASRKSSLRPDGDGLTPAFLLLPLTLTSPETCSRATPTLLPCLVTCSVCPTCSTRRVEPTSGLSAHAVAQPARSRPSPCSTSLSHTTPSMIPRVSLSAATTARGRPEAHRRVRCD